MSPRGAGILKFLLLGAWILQSCTAAAVNGDEEDSLDQFTNTPTFTTRGTTYRAIIGDTIVLPCQADNLGRYLLLWKRGNTVLSVGDLKVSVDPRIQLVDDYNLEIRKVRVHDAGDYICQLNTLRPEEQIHTLEILVPPSVRTEPSSGHVTITRGDTMTLQCRANGNPVPSIRWTRKNNLLPNGEHFIEGNSFEIQRASRKDVGVYVCTASNGVGTPVFTSIHVKVQFPPEVEVEQNLVHAGEGFEAALTCTAHSDPPATVRWYRDTLSLHTTDRRLIEERGSKHTLVIRKVHESDFGNYSCVADNKLGRATKHIELSGKPNRAIFRSDPKGNSPDTFNMTWFVESYSPVSEYRLLYRRATTNASAETGQPGAEWTDVVLPATDFTRSSSSSHTGNTLMMSGGTNSLGEARLPSLGSNFHMKSYHIKNLEPHTGYEARVSAKNRFGWSAPSDPFYFWTRTTEPDPFEGAPQNDLFSDPGYSDMGISAASSNAFPSFVPRSLRTTFLAQITRSIVILPGILLFMN